MACSVRQQARVKARLKVKETQAARRREQAAADKRRAELGVAAAVALEERDAAVRRHEVVAGRAIRRLMSVEKVGMRELGDWIPDLDATEVRRLVQVAEDEESAARDEQI